MIWLLPLIVIGGFFYPLLGYLVVGMMAFLLTLSYFKGRYWCTNFCPRGAFLDIVILRMSLKRRVPKILTKMWFRWMIVALFMSFLVFRITRAGGDVVAIGMVFVIMCAVTTAISIALGVSIRHRTWCMMCPMGTLQDKIGRLSKKRGCGCH